jgi:hypothetical protein
MLTRPVSALTRSHAPDDRRPFDINALEAERAAWESEKMTHYRLARTF